MAAGCPPVHGGYLRAWLDDGLLPDDLTNPQILAQYAQRNRRDHRKLRAPIFQKFAMLLRFLNERGVLQAVIDRERSTHTWPS